MRKVDILIGTIKRCDDIKNYQKYGESQYIKETDFDDISFGVIESYTTNITNQAILIRYDNERFIWLNSLNHEENDLIIAGKLPVKILKTEPKKDNDLFVDTKAKLVPYYNYELSQNISLKQLKKDLTQEESNSIKK